LKRSIGKRRRRRRKRKKAEEVEEGEGGKVVNEALESFFANLRNRGGNIAAQ
jgi:hypothetical protein